MTVENRISELVSDEEFVKGAYEASCLEEFVSTMEKFNVVFQDVEIEDAYKAFIDAKKRMDSGELNEEMMDSVSGGGPLGVSVSISIAAGGTAAVACVGILAVAGLAAWGMYLIYSNNKSRR